MKRILLIMLLAILPVTACRELMMAPPRVRQAFKDLQSDDYVKVRAAIPAFFTNQHFSLDKKKKNGITISNSYFVGQKEGWSGSSAKPGGPK